MSGFQPHAESLIIEPAAHDEDFFRVFMALAAKPGCVRARVEFRQPSVLAGGFVDGQCEFISYASKPLIGFHRSLNSEAREFQYVDVVFAMVVSVGWWSIQPPRVWPR